MCAGVRCHSTQLKDSIVRGEERLLYLSPEKLCKSSTVKEAVKMLHELEGGLMVVIDEAHLLYEWHRKCVPEPQPSHLPPHQACPVLCPPPAVWSSLRCWADVHTHSRPAYEAAIDWFLNELPKRLDGRDMRRPRFVAVTATATPKMEAAIRQRLSFKQDKAQDPTFRSSIFRSNLELRIYG